MTRNKRPIKDSTVHRTGFMYFKRSSVVDGGSKVLFTYESGAAYKVPTKYILEWFDQPHNRLAARGQRRGLSLLSDEESNHPKPNAAAKGKRWLLRSRVVRDRFVVRLYFSDNTAYDVPWDTLLMACEPDYEHYGGLTPESRKLTRIRSREHGSFRVDR